MNRRFLRSNASASDPIDATLYFDESTNRYEINPGSLGTKLDIDSIMETVQTALAQRNPYAALTSVNLVHQSVKADDRISYEARHGERLSLLLA